MQDMQQLDLMDFYSNYDSFIYEDIYLTIPELENKPKDSM